MRRYTLLVAIVFIFSSVTAWAAPPVLKQFGGITLGDSGEKMIAALGEPDEISGDFELPQEVAPSGAIIYNICDNASVVVLVGKISPMHARVLQVTVQGERCAETGKFAVDGIALGATEQQIVAKFGEPNRIIERTEGLPKTIAYHDSNAAFNINDDGVLVGISVVYRNNMMVDDLVSRENKPRVDAWMSIADMRLRGRQMELAAEALEKVLEANPKSIEANVKMGSVWLALGELDKAKASYDTVIAEEPNNPVATYNLGRVAVRKDEPEEARRLLNKAITLDSDNPAIYNELGLLDENEGKLDDAIKRFEKSAELAPQASQPRQNLGRIYLKKGQEQMAADQFQQALILELRNPVPNRELVALLREVLAELRGEQESTSTTAPTTGS